MLVLPNQAASRTSTVSSRTGATLTANMTRPLPRRRRGQGRWRRRPGQPTLREPWRGRTTQSWKRRAYGGGRAGPPSADEAGRGGLGCEEHEAAGPIWRVAGLARCCAQLAVAVVSVVPARTKLKDHAKQTANIKNKNKQRLSVLLLAKTSEDQRLLCDAGCSFLTANPPRIGYIVNAETNVKLTKAIFLRTPTSPLGHRQ